MKLIKKGLGKGLKALIPPVPLADEENKDIQWLDLTYIQPNENQPRRNIDKEKLNELARSIKEHGVVQPIIVRRKTDNRYEIVAGERRWRACQLAEMDKIPAIIKDYSPQQVSEIALIENIQREDLNPIEESWAFKTLIEEYNLTQEELAKKVGKSRPYIANTLRLLNLPAEVKSLLSEGQLSTGHARALLSIQDDAIQKEIAYRIIDEKLSVRQVEDMIAHMGESSSREDEKEDKKTKELKTNENKIDPLVDELEEKLQTYFGTKVQLKYQKGKGRIEISYYSDDELDRLLEIILEDEHSA